MDLVTIDFETFYGDGYTLSSMTTEEYVRDPRFEAILLSFKVNDNPAFFVPRDLIPQWLGRMELHKKAVAMHHAHFDALILNHHYNVRPKLIIDTLGMARALHGVNGRLSLEKLSERYGLKAKGKEVLNARNKRYKDFSVPELKKYGEYSCDDSDICHGLVKIMAPQFSRAELEINDRIVRMFTEPKLVLDVDMLRAYATRLGAEKMTLMMRAAAQRDDLMSNDKFAQMLIELGVAPPMKISPTWLKKSQEERKGDGIVYAFAKTDPGMQALQEHPDERVQVLVEARLKNKSTLAESRAQRMIGMASRGPACIYLKYSGASGTHRLSGGDKMNWQNFTRGSDLRRAVMAPPGYRVVVGDSSNIEARLLDWLAGQDDMVQVYIKADAKLGPDKYCMMATKIYGFEVIKELHPMERQIGKNATLGLGYGMGPDKFIILVRSQAKDANDKPVVLQRDFAVKVVDIYRGAHPHVKKLWKRGENALKAIARGEIGVAVDQRGIVTTCKDGLLLQNGLRILYPDLKHEANPDNGWEGGEWSFWNGKTREYIYGAKVIENIVQCLARIIVFEQCRKAAIELTGIADWVHSVHDEGVFMTHEFYAPYVKDRLLANMRLPLAWCEGLPLNSEGGFAQRYGDAKK